MSMIDREKLIEDMNQWARDNFSLDDSFEYLLVGMEKALGIIESQPPADQWIPCSEARKPADGQRVVVTTDLMKGSNYINTAYYYTKKPNPLWGYEWDGEGFYQSYEWGYFRRKDVIAWFAVEPYKGE